MSAPWTPEEHAAARARCEAVVFKTWERGERDDCGGGMVIATWPATGGGKHSTAVADVDCEEDLDFIAHARADLPRALDHIEAQAAGIERCNAALDQAEKALETARADLIESARLSEEALAHIRAIRGGE